MTYGDRTQRVGLRLTPIEARVVAELSDETGLTVSDVVRQAIRKAYADRFKARRETKRKTSTHGA